jgi:hypothetical protein
MTWNSLITHPLLRSLGTLVLVAGLGLGLNAVRRSIEDQAMAAIDDAEAASFHGQQRLHLESSGADSAGGSAAAATPTAAPDAVDRTCLLPVAHPARLLRPKKVRPVILDI